MASSLRPVVIFSAPPAMNGAVSLSGMDFGWSNFIGLFFMELMILTSVVTNGHVS